MARGGIPFARSRFTAQKNVMTITLNGQKRDAGDATTIGELLAQIGLGGKPVVVEHNQRALFPREIAMAAVSEGDVIEVVQVTAGG